MYYLIKNSIRKFKAITHGSVFDTITRDTFANIEVNIPNLDTQRKIAKFLSNIDDKIENNQRVNNNLPPHPCYARIAAKQRRQTPKTDECLHTDGKVSDRGGNEETAEQFSSQLAA